VGNQPCAGGTSVKTNLPSRSVRSVECLQIKRNAVQSEGDAQKNLLICAGARAEAQDSFDSRPRLERDF